MADLGFQMVRYADDFVILCRTPEEAEAALAEVREWVEDKGLRLHPEKTHIVDSREKSFSFLGYSFRGRFRFPRAKSHRKFVARIQELTPRKSGESLEVILQRLNGSTQGWFNYFRHCHWNIFKDYDGLTRRRLRRMLLKPTGRIENASLEPFHGLNDGVSSNPRNLLTGEPYAGEPHVRLEGSRVTVLPYPYLRSPMKFQLRVCARITW